MQEPVRCSDGYVYERKVITDWLLQRGTSPVTFKPHNNADLVPETALRAEITDWINRGGGRIANAGNSSEQAAKAKMRPVNAP